MSTNQPPKLCGLATASLVLAIMGLLLGIFFTGILFTIPAVILGLVAVVRIKKSAGTMSGIGLAIAGLILGSAGIGLEIFVDIHLLERMTERQQRGRIHLTRSIGQHIYSAMFVHATESAASGNGFDWPQSDTYATSTAVFTNLLIRGVLKKDYSLFAAPGLPACVGTNAALFKAENNAWCVVADVKDSDSDQMPLLFTRNLKINSLAEFKGVEQLSDDPPFGRKCVLVIFKGGEAQKFTPDMLASNFNTCHATNRVLRP